MSRDIKGSDFFLTGGALPPDSSSYIKRPADDKLFQLILAGQLSCVLTSARMGKSSLLTRTARRLQAQGISTAIINLSGIDSDISIEQLTLWLIKRLTSQLNLSIDPDSWRAEHPSLDTEQLFSKLLHDVALAEVEGPIVIFVDQINNSIINLDFFKKLSAAIQFVHNARANDPAYNRLTFVLAGVVAFAGLIKDRGLPVNRDQQIDLCEFSWEKAQVFRQGLQAAYPEQGAKIFTRTFHWTNGHPYLTQKICSVITRRQSEHWTDESIDGLVEDLFLSTAARNESGLQFVKDSIITSRRRRKLLTRLSPGS